MLVPRRVSPCVSLLITWFGLDDFSGVKFVFPQVEVMVGVAVAVWV